jgi:hypothetical protein
LDLATIAKTQAAARRVARRAVAAIEHVGRFFFVAKRIVFVADGFLFVAERIVSACAAKRCPTAALAPSKAKAPRAPRKYRRPTPQISQLPQVSK